MPFGTVLKENKLSVVCFAILMTNYDQDTYFHLLEFNFCLLFAFSICPPHHFSFSFFLLNGVRVNPFLGLIV